MRHSDTLLLITVAGLAAAGILSVPPASVTAARAADDKAIHDRLELCATCHGKTGISEQHDIPSLAGQPDQFLQWQLVFFRSGSRKNEKMSPVAEQLSNEEIRALGAWFAAQTPPVAPDDPDPALSEKGKALARQNRCISCHTEAFTGAKATPRLVGQKQDYLVKALHDFKAGRRTGGGVAAMADVTYSLSDDDIHALAHYIAHYK